jgi:hypothetical protein
MTEAQWLACDDPLKMLAHPAGKGSDRKLRLFAAACCRRIWHVLEARRYQEAVLVVERLAEGLASPAECEKVREKMLAAAKDQNWDWAGWAAVRAFSFHPWVAADGTTQAVIGLRDQQGQEAEKREQAGLLRDILGNPFRPLPEIAPIWLTPDTIALAQAAYEERTLPAGTLDPTRLGILADALEEAGCNDTAILAHLRDPGPHVRGCWALDLVLVKE